MPELWRRDTLMWVAAAAAVGLTAVAGSFNVQRMRNTEHAVRAGHEALAELHGLVSDTTDAETGHRGYLLTGRPDFLGPYRESETRVQRQLAALDSRWENEPPKTARLGQMRQLVADKFTEMQKTRDLRDGGGLEAAAVVVATGQGKRIMDDLRELAADAERDERAELHQLAAAANRQYQTVEWTNLIGAVLAVGVIGVSGVLLRRDTRRLAKAAAALAETAAALATEKQASDRALAQLDALVRNAPYSIAFLDHDLRPVRVNEAFARTTRIAVEDHCGHCLPDLFPDLPSDLLTKYQEVLAGGPPVVGRLVFGDGRVWEVSAFCVPLDDTHGGLGIIGQDVTERQEVADRLHRSEVMFRAMADGIPQLAWMARPDGHLFWYNRRWYEYTGNTLEEMEGWGWERVHDPVELKRMSVTWRAALASGQPWEDTFPLRRHDGQMRWHLTRATPLTDDGGNVTLWFGTNTDVTDQRRIEGDLRDARRFSESVLHSLPSHLAVIEADGNILSVNEAWRQTGEASGLPLDHDWTTANYYEAVRQNTHGGRAEAGIRAVATGERGAFEMEYPSLVGGVERHYLLRANRFRGDGPVRVVVTHEDVTDRVVAERQVREAASQLAQLTEGVPLLMWACRPTGECDYLSRQWLDYTGRGLVEQLGSGWLDAVHPEDREPTAEAWRKAVDAGGGFEVEYRLRRHDAAYRWFAVRGIPLRDQTGTVVRWFGSCTDVDDRVQQEELLGRLVEERTLALNEQKIFLNAILDNVAEGIVACDAEGNLQLFNAATRRIHGLPAEPLPAEQWADQYQLFEADGATPMPTERLPLRRAWRGEEVRDAEMVVRAAGQPERFLVCFGQPLRADDGRVFGAVVSMRDMTDRREYERELVRTADALRVSNDELEKFAYIASHDLQEPLRKIQAFGTRLSDKFRAAVGEQGKDYIDRMLDSAGRMRRLIEDLLAFSRVTTKGAAFVSVDLNAVARDVLSDLEERVARSGGTVQVGPLPTVPGDPSQLRQVFQNLIGNALKFARPDVPPVVRVTAVPFDRLPADAPPAAAGWRISVADNGIGFDPQYTDRIFELFQRLHGRGEYEGTGLGLAIVRKIVVRHGAAITAHSRPGQGAEFVLDWPARPVTEFTPPGA